MTILRSPGSLRPPGALYDYITIFLASVALMLFQLTLTRVLSVVVWYHFTFLILSTVMLGLSLPGVWFSLRGVSPKTLSRLLLLGGISIPLSVILIVKFGAAWHSVSIVLVIACILPGMISLGGIICLLLMKAAGASITRMYGVDLLGACLGATLVIPLMNGFPTPQLAAATGFLTLIPLTLRSGFIRCLGWLLIGLLAFLLLGTSVFKVTRSKAYDETVVPPIYEKWSPTARLTVFDERFLFLDGHEYGFSWGRGQSYPRDETIRHYWLEQDGSAGTPITGFDGDLARQTHLLYDVTSLGLEVFSPDTVAIIGAGGGRDILAALLVGAADIDAIEVNRHTVETVSRRFGEFSGDIYHFPGVNAVIGDGRSHLTRTKKVYDLIEISVTDSWAASAAGAYALAENNLYTVEAFELYLRRLSPGGCLVVNRWLREVPWLVLLADRALTVSGAESPTRHMAIAWAQGLTTMLISKRPLEPETLARFEEVAKERGFTPIYPVPRGRRAFNPFIVQAVEEGRAALDGLGLEIRPAVDDRPYFFHVVSPFGNPDQSFEKAVKASDMSFNVQPTVALRNTVFWVCIPALLLLLVLPGWVMERSGVSSKTLLGWGSLYFAAIGAGFMLTENVLIQRFVLYLGHPSYATTVIIASLLLGMGLGSMSAFRWGVRRLARWGFLIPFLLALLVVVLPGFFKASLGLPLGARALMSILCLLPVGFSLGVFFPLGMIRFGDELKPWFWALNGFFGVVASVLSLALSMEFGFHTVGFLGAGIYLVAWLALRARTPLPG
jgi:hypothetical protein